ncbi:GPO family capsid scaffolding protein, partial [Iodobacter sp. CM08]|uniref:GPO family capsid scaffolding protein n=1 Tax=Iodobacter sp. CM08 TaxID=3085902 RepID=UPI0029815CB4
EAPTVSILDSVKKIFAKKEVKANQQFSDIQQAIEAVAEYQAETAEGHSTLNSRMDELNASITELREFKAKIENEPAHFSGSRDKATGGTGSLETDC